MSESPSTLAVARFGPHIRIQGYDVGLIRQNIATVEASSALTISKQSSSNFNLIKTIQPLFICSFIVL